jgi:formylglycine-generating enzyme required for sulfatase activity
VKLVSYLPALLACAAFVPAATGAQLRFGPQGTIELLDSSGEMLAHPEPVVHWNGSVPSVLKSSSNSVQLALTPNGLIAAVTGPEKGRYGEFVFAIEVRNSSREEIKGALLPPYSDWRDTEQGIRSHSTQFMLLTSARVEIGTIGVHRAWSAGNEFDGDIFTTVPDKRGQGYVSSVLLLLSREISHEHERIALKPGQSCRYELHIEAGPGGRNGALRETYRVRGGYRVDPASYRFDAYKAPETSWAKNITAVWMNWAWDEANMDPRNGTWRLAGSIAAARKKFGGFDGFVFWPFWPRAGFDARFQFDHYADLPGGLAGLRSEIDQLHAEGVHVFISYCHWSESDRDRSPEAMEQSYAEFAKVACTVKADGAVMDLMSKTPEDILERARACGRTLVPYNEGDPTWSDTQTNLLGRIHNDLPMPEFNLKRYLLPHHPQLRVCEPGNSGRRMRNDFVLSFFNGHGVEINTMFPDSNPANDADWPILARALDLLRTHRSNFTSAEWQPLIQSEDAAVWVNSWPTAGSTVYTLCGTNPAGHHGPLLRIPHRADVHYIDLWRYRPLIPHVEGNADVIAYDVEGYVPGLGSVRGTADYSPGSIGVFPRRLRASLDFEMLHVSTEHPAKGEEVEVWLDTVQPGAEPVILGAGSDAELDLYRQFGRHTNDAIVLRLVNMAGEVEDVDVVPETAVRFFRIDKPQKTTPVRPGEAPPGMIRIPGGNFHYRLTNPRPPAEYPYASPPFQPTYAYMPGQPAIDRETTVKPFWIDRYPVTNNDYARFLAATGYRPNDATNFLKHFVDGHVPPGLGEHPVIYVSYDDAKAYAAWAGKRLPTEEEWQFAAGAADGREWPWGNDEDTTRFNSSRSGTEPVNGHPQGASPYGVEDLVGNVWQWTASLMDNGRQLTVMLRGGSWYYPPKGRWWVPGGARRITENYPLPLAGPGMNRLATVGFRCVKDE